MEETNVRGNFIWDAIDKDLEDKRYTEIHTRFPPEPNGYMHIGHCKALIMDFLTAEKYTGPAVNSTLPTTMINAMKLPKNGSAAALPTWTN